MASPKHGSKAEADAVIRELRVYWAQQDRAPWWYRNAGHHPDLWKTRAEGRRWRRRLFANDAFRQVAAHDRHLTSLTLIVERLVSWYTWPPEVEGLAQQWRRATQTARDAAEAVRRYAKRSLREDALQAALSLADRIESDPLAQMDEPEWNQRSLHGYEYGLLGQQGGRRAFLIRLLDHRLPGLRSLPGRYAIIAGLVQFLGHKDTTPQLVRSTLLNGRT